MIDIEATKLLPRVAYRGGGAEYFTRLMQPLLDIGDDIDCLVDAFAHPELAEGPVLDFLGVHLSEPRGGLNDTEYRTILLGRLVARWGRHGSPAVWRCWCALTSTTDGRLELLPGFVGFRLTTQIRWKASTAWAMRAAAILHEVVGHGWPYEALVALPDSVYFDGSTDVGSIPYDLGA